MSVQYGEKLYDFTTGESYKYLITRTNFGYMKFVEEFRSSIIGQSLISVEDLLTDTGVEPSVEDYMNELFNIIELYDLGRSPEIKEQKQMDHLKTAEDYLVDITNIGVDMASVIGGLSSSPSQLESDILTSIDGLSTVLDSVRNAKDVLINLDTVMQNYKKYDAFLSLIENNSDGDLKKASSALRRSMQNGFSIKLAAYRDVSDYNNVNFTEFFFDDIFFEAIKEDDAYKSDETLKFLVDNGEAINESKNLLQASWKLGLGLGKLIGNVTVGGEDQVQRIHEMEAVCDISFILQSEITHLQLDIIPHNYGNIPFDMDGFVDYLYYLVCCRERGEYCLYTLRTQNSGLLSLIEKLTSDDSKIWYEKQTGLLNNVRKGLSAIFELDDVSEEIQIVSDLKNLPYIGNTTYNTSVRFTEDMYITVDAVDVEGILSAFKEDFDRDGKEEIFALTYEPGTVFENKQNTMKFSLFKETDGEWNMTAETEVYTTDPDGNYHDLSFLSSRAPYVSDVSIFLRNYKGEYQFFVESYDFGVFSDGTIWYLRGYRCDGNSFSLMPETKDLNFNGSEFSYNWQSGNYPFSGVYYGLGFTKNDFDSTYLTVDQNSDVYEIVRMTQNYNLSQEQLNDWFFSQQGSLAGFFRQIKDVSILIPDGELPECDAGSASADAPKENNPDGEYLLPYSNSRYLTDEDIDGMSQEEIQRAVNEIYARHGKVFMLPENDEYFRSKGWYVPIEGKTDEEITQEFNEYEWKNVDLMARFL